MKFNPDTNLTPSNAPSTIGYSQGIGTNKIGETLFGGLADAAAGFARGQDQLNQYNIYQDTLKSTDTVRNEFGVTAATQAFEGKTPDAVVKGQSDLEVLYKAYENGVISDTYYYVRLNDIVKGLRSKYPGYDEQIDNIIQNVTGVTPANAIVNSIRNEANQRANASDAAKNQDYQYVKENEKYIKTAFPDWQGWGDTKYSMSEIRAAVPTLKAQEFDKEQQKADISLQNERGTLDSNKIVKYSNSQATNAANLAVKGALGTIGTNYADAQSILKQYADGTKTLDPKDAEAILNKLGEAKTQLSLFVQSQLRGERVNPNDPGSDTYWSRLNKDQQAEVMANSTGMIDLLIESVTNKDYGKIAVINQYINAVKSSDAKALIDTNEAARRLQAASAVMPPEAFKYAFDAWIAEGGHLAEFDKVFGWDQIMKSQIPLPPKPGQPTQTPPSLNRTIEDTRNNPNLNPDTGPAVVKATVNQLIGSDHPVVQTSAIKQLFGNAGGLDLNLFDQSQHSKIYSTLVNDTVTKQVKAASATDPALWSTYTKWSYDKFDDVFARLSGDIRQMDLSGIADVTFDSVNNQFVVNPILPNATTRGFGTTVTAPNPYARIQKLAQDRYGELNTALKSISGVLKEDGKDISQTLPFFMQELGLNPSLAAPKADKQSSNDTGKMIQNASYDVGGQPVNGIEFVASLEGFNANAYADGTQHSIGYGTKATPDEIKNGTPISKEEARVRLTQELSKAADYVDKVIQVPLNPNQHLALASLVYNVGHIGPNLVNAINSGDQTAINHYWLQYTGSTVPNTKKGLETRRKKELSLFNGGTQIANAPVTSNTKSPTTLTSGSQQPYSAQQWIQDFGSGGVIDPNAMNNPFTGVQQQPGPQFNPVEVLQSWKQEVTKSSSPDLKKVYQQLSQELFGKALEDVTTEDFKAALEKAKTDPKARTQLAAILDQIKQHYEQNSGFFSNFLGGK